MDDNWAEESLHTIRTLMERAALYRHALAPAALFTGGLGIAGAALALFLRLEGVASFALYWAGVALLTSLGVFGLLRRESIRSNDPFWSPPAKRVMQAMCPAVVTGLIFSFGLVFAAEPRVGPSALPLIAAAWMVLFGIAQHSAGFFLQRGINLSGWLFIAMGLAAAIYDIRWPAENPVMLGNLMMGVSFGGLHLAYGVYLYFTEKAE